MVKDRVVKIKKKKLKNLDNGLEINLKIINQKNKLWLMI